MAIRLGAFLLLLFLFGCRGVLYTDITLPSTRNFNSTPVGSKKCTVQNHRVKLPIGREGLTSEWSTGAIAKAAKEAGIREIHYADKRTLRFFFGLYMRETIILYGD